MEKRWHNKFDEVHSDGIQADNWLQKEDKIEKFAFINCEYWDHGDSSSDKSAIKIHHSDYNFQENFRHNYSITEVWVKRINKFIAKEERSWSVSKPK